MRLIEPSIAVISTLAAGVLTGIVRAWAIQRGILDVPNARSSHTDPTPRGGGLAIVVTTLCGTGLLAWLDVLDASDAAVLVLAGAIVALVGYVDDRRGLPAAPRFAVHILASVLVVALLSRHLVIDASGGALACLVAGLLVLGTTWSINLFNFMDGIDGIAASEALFVSAASAALVLAHGDVASACLPLLTAGACLGFLAWNWPPAKIFMGDVGSGFLGLWLAAVALWLHASGALSIWTSIVLSSLFVGDATATLAVRFARRQRWFEAHRSHVYQRLACRWRSHLKVTGLTWIVNLTLVLPLALVTQFADGFAPAAAVLCETASVALAIFAGAGQDQHPARTPG